MQIKVEDYVNIDKERILRNKDFFMNQLLQDPRLVLWLLYCVGGYKPEMDRKEFKNYLQSLSASDLRKIVQPRPNQFKSEDQAGNIFDDIFAIYEGDDLLCFFNAENQIKYHPAIELLRRSRAYVSTMDFKQQDYLPDKEHYRYLQPDYSAWILPQVAQKDQNSVLFFTNPDGVITNYQRESLTFFPFDTGLHSIFFLAGEEVKLNFNPDTPDKYLIGLELIDLLYNFRESKESRLKKLEEYFGFSGKETKDMIDRLSEFSQELNQFAQQYAKDTYQPVINKKDEVINKKDKENNQLKAELTKQNEELEALKKRIMELELKISQN